MLDFAEIFIFHRESEYSDENLSFTKNSLRTFKGESMTQFSE